jgi:putative membrane protein
MLSRLPRAERRAMALDSRKSSFRPSARSRVALIVNAKADVASTNGSLSSQKIRNPYSLPRSERARADEWRTVYDFPQWIEHRNTARLFLNFASSVKSQVLLNILPSVAWCTGVATLLCTYMYMLKTGILPSSFPNPQPNIACQTFINATSVALSLLLVFRTNNGYGRWDEARKLWGLLVNRTRDLIRQGVQTFPEEDFKGKKALGRWIIAATQALRIHLQPDPGVTLESTLGSTLSPNELAILKKSAHRPMSAISAIGRIIQDQPISPYMQALMYQNLTAFHDILGGCERILRGEE